MIHGLLEVARAPAGFFFDPYCVLYLPFYRLDGRSDGLDVSFMSKDHYGHAVTNSGAKWTPQGYLLDSVDDIIVVPDHTAIQDIFDSPGGTIVAWINPTSVGEGGTGNLWNKVRHLCFLYTDSGAGTCKFRFGRHFSTANGVWEAASSAITYLKPQMLSLSYDNSSVTNAPIATVDGNTVVMTEIQAPVGARVSDIANSLCIGNNAATSGTFGGYINALWAFKGKMLSPVELQQIFLATKGRWGR